MTVEEVIGKVFKKDPDELDDTITRDMIEEWDSMGHLTLITELEQTFGVNFSIADAMELTSIRTIKERLKEYGKDQHGFLTWRFLRRPGECITHTQDGLGSVALTALWGPCYPVNLGHSNPWGVPPVGKGGCARTAVFISFG